MHIASRPRSQELTQGPQYSSICPLQSITSLQMCLQVVGMEKAEWRRMNPAEHAERMAREAKDK